MAFTSTTVSAFILERVGRGLPYSIHGPPDNQSILTATVRCVYCDRLRRMSESLQCQGCGACEAEAFDVRRFIEGH
jgi:hypothetical protein